jgi:hypothetical protein
VPFAPSPFIVRSSRSPSRAPVVVTARVSLPHDGGGETPGRPLVLAVLFFFTFSSLISGAVFFRVRVWILFPIRNQVYLFSFLYPKGLIYGYNLSFGTIVRTYRVFSSRSAHGLAPRRHGRRECSGTVSAGDGVGVGGEKRCSGASGGASRRWQCHPRDRTKVRSGGG